ncbi:MAG TPA: DNA repair protein RadC [Casimicrobiaceae bacterium]
MSIASWPAGERPRERLLAQGVAALTDAELLAVVLGTGCTGATSLDVARDLLARYRGLSALLAESIDKLARIKGLGTAKAAKLVAGVEITRRLLREEVTHGSALTSPEAVRDYLRLSLASLPHEAFVVLFLDSQHRLLAADELFRGTLAQTSVYPREIVKAALSRNAAAVIFAHNHPSGVAEPSRADELLTQALKQALALVDIRTLDHFVVAGDRVVSFAERGLL